MLDHLDAKELNTIALSYTYKAHKKNPNDVILSELTDSLFSEMVNSNELYLSDFSKSTKAQLLAIDTAAIPAVISAIIAVTPTFCITICTVKILSAFPVSITAPAIVKLKRPQSARLAC